MDEIKEIKLSATRVSMFLSCKWKYFCNYMLHLPRKPNISFKLGTAVHESLSLAGSIWQVNEKFSAADIAKIKDMYNKTAAKEGILDTSVYHEGLHMIMSKMKFFTEGKILTIEDKFEVKTPSGITLMGAMDKVEQLHDDTILVVDYKTSKYQETTDELKSDIQLSMYDAVASIKYPEYKCVVLCLDYLRAAPVFTYRTIGEREGFINYITAVYSEMMKLKQEYAVPNLNDMCNWCDFTDNCTAYQDVLAGKTFFKKNPEEYSNEELVKDYMDVKNRKRILDNREKQLKQYILSKIKSDEHDVIGKEKMIYIRQNSNTMYDPAVVYEVVPIDEFLRMITISKRDVDEYLEKHPAGKSKIMEKSKTSYTSPFLATKNVRGGEDY
jgi:hypothetical protein